MSFSNNYADGWNSGSASTGAAFDLWKSDLGPRYVRDHWSVRWAQHSPEFDGFDDIAISGHRGDKRAKIAREHGKETILMAELRADLRNNGTIRPHSDFGVAEYVIRPVQDARTMLGKARERGAKILQCMSEVIGTWPDSPPLRSYEALVSELLDRAGDIKIIADFHPDMSPSIAAACWRLDDHFFWRAGETGTQMRARIEITADAIVAKGCVPTCLEYSAGRGSKGSSWTLEGERRHGLMREHLGANGYNPIGIFYGFAGLGKIWTAPGWGNWHGLYLTDGRTLSPVMKEMVADMGPPVEPERTKDEWIRFARKGLEAGVEKRDEFAKDDGTETERVRKIDGRLLNALEAKE